jgi:hypothetical protein
MPAKVSVLFEEISRGAAIKNGRNPKSEGHCRLGNALRKNALIDPITCKRAAPV